ncbi:MAG: DUF952 domain-containing protein [Aestuariivirga sp.]
MPMIFKIIDASAHQAATLSGQFSGAEIDLKDGYIHFSTAAQVAETAKRHFAGRSNLMLWAIDAEALGPALKWEPSRGGQLFPHLYAPLGMQYVVWAKPLAWDGTAHVFPPEALA